ncbi:MAG TPA: hypothetical protein VKU94_05945 [Geobacterales bacterium]|nr:hypothetical protein [Geobacterales bacterium]
MSVEEAFQEVERVKKEVEAKVEELRNTKPFLGDIVQDVFELYKRIKEEIFKIRAIRKEIERKLSSKEFDFIKNNFNLDAKDLETDRYKSYDELAYILKIKTYHAYNWDYFLEPWIKYYEELDKLKYYLREFRNKIKVINYYTKLNSFSTTVIDQLLKA